MNIYYHPEEYGLTTIGDIAFGDEDYRFDILVVWQRASDGVFFYGEDSGCSCPTPFEDMALDDLTMLPKRGGLDMIKDAMQRGRAGELTGDMVELLGRLYAAGLR